MEIWIATTNKGKLSEYKTLLTASGHTVHSPLDLSVYTAPPETGKTFLENARIKARTMKALRPGKWVLGEDSGLEVDGLGGLPGIHSARYAGPKAADSENTAKLLKMMSLRSAQNRKAKFVCTIVAYSPDGTEHVISEVMDGQIAQKQTGTGGFGYDPIFIPEGETKTLGELTDGFKNKHSHRAKAVRKLSELLK